MNPGSDYAWAEAARGLNSAGSLVKDMLVNKLLSDEVIMGNSNYKPTAEREREREKKDKFS